MKKQKFRLTRGTAVLIILLAAAVLTAAVIVRGNSSGRADASTSEGRINYLAQLGWQAVPSSEQYTVITLPESFGDVMSGYNELQLRQGFDMTAYAGMECGQYTYSVTNYPTGEKVFATLYVCRGRIIGGDIHSASSDGFMHTLK